MQLEFQKMWFKSHNRKPEPPLLPSEISLDITKMQVLKSALNFDFPIDLWHGITARVALSHNGDAKHEV